MIKKYFLFLALIFLVATSAKSDRTVSFYAQTGEIAASFTALSLQQLFDTANYYFRKNSGDTALVSFELLINKIPTDAANDLQKKVAVALNRSAIIYFNRGNFRRAYELLIRALIQSERINYISYIPRIHSNIANIYYHFNKKEVAREHYLRALEMFEDSIAIGIVSNNLGSAEVRLGNMDDAYRHLSKALRIATQYNSAILPSIHSNLGLYHQRRGQFALAHHYYLLSLNSGTGRMTAEVSANLASLFFETNQIDSALRYISLSNTIATRYNHLLVLANNHRLLSQIEERGGRRVRAFEYLKTYIALRDSIVAMEQLADIGYLHRLYEITIANERVEQLVVERQIRERTIRYQRTISAVMLIALILAGVALWFIFLQVRKLKTAYRALFEKNLAIMEMQEKKKAEKYKNSSHIQDELLDKILAVMEDTSVICDTEFTIDKLADLVQSNRTYVSQTINNVLEKNFRAFLNGYRIQEAQRLFSEPDKTVETVALRVGFRSQSAFRDAFKEITGVSPNFYLKSIKSQIITS